MRNFVLGDEFFLGATAFLSMRRNCLFSHNNFYPPHFYRCAMAAYWATAATLQGPPCRRAKGAFQCPALDGPHGCRLARLPRLVGKMECGLPALCVLVRQRPFRAPFSGCAAARHGRGDDGLDVLPGASILGRRAQGPRPASHRHHARRAQHQDSRCLRCLEATRCALC